jgi:hypothetical protein
MPRKMNLDLTGVTFSDEVHSDVGASAFVLDHDWFTEEDLVIRTAAAGGGTLLVLDTDYQLSEESTDDATKGIAGLSTRTAKSVYHKVQIINASYQTGALYFSGKYIADSADADDWAIPLLIPQPWLKSLSALLVAALHTGSATTDVSMALKDTGEDFSDVAFGDIVRNTTSRAFATVLYKSGTDTLYLDADIFPAGTEAYAVYAQPVVSEQDGLEDFMELTGAKLDGDGTKVADNDTLNHLKDADGTDWTTICAAGDWAMNLATGKLAKITTVAAHDLTLQWDAFPSGNEKYMIFAGTVEITDPNSPLYGEILEEMNIGGRYFGGRLSSGNAEDDRMQGHEHETGAIPTSTGTRFDHGTAHTVKNNATGDVGATLSSTDLIVADDTNGTPRTGEDTRPRTLGATMIVRIK